MFAKLQLNVQSERMKFIITFCLLLIPICQGKLQSVVKFRVYYLLNSEHTVHLLGYLLGNNFLVNCAVK